MYYVKNYLFACYKIKEKRDGDNEIGFKEGGVIEIETTVDYNASIRDARSFALYLTYNALHKRANSDRIRVCIRKLATTEMHMTYGYLWCNKLIAM